MEKCAQEIKKANDVGDTKTVYSVVKTLSGKTDKKPPVDLNINKETGKPIGDATERAEVWHTFLQRNSPQQQKKKMKGLRWRNYHRETPPTS